MQCSVLQCVVVCCSVEQTGSSLSSEVQCVAAVVAVCRGVLQCVAGW